MSSAKSKVSNQKPRVKKYSLKQARKDLPKIKVQDNKTRGGRCLIVAGSRGKWGAAILCAESAARIGAGYVYMLDANQNFPTAKNPDFLMIDEFQNLSRFQSAAVGPGFSNHQLIIKLIKKLKKQKFPNVILDAEALTAISKLKKRIVLPATWIISPHEGELSKLLRVSSATIRNQRSKYVTIAQKKMNCIVLLKGFKTLIATKDELYEVQSGNPALAKAGTGDALTGMIAGLLSQNLAPVKAACLAAFTHGFIADQWINEKNDHLSLLASDLVKRLPAGLMLLRNNQNKKAATKIKTFAS